MSNEFWSFMNILLQQYGLFALIGFAQFVIILYFFRLVAKKEEEKSELQERLLEVAEKRFKDAKEGQEDYESLAHNLDKSINLLISVIRRNGNNGP